MASLSTATPSVEIADKQLPKQELEVGANSQSSSAVHELFSSITSCITSRTSRSRSSPVWESSQEVTVQGPVGWPPQTSKPTTLPSILADELIERTQLKPLFSAPPLIARQLTGEEGSTLSCATLIGNTYGENKKAISA
ncbi:MAG: hypothetical protein KTR25_06505 [Myxococcales bacterium]|nr:hypothetical protein [Myxococcales bacterium]